MNNQKILKIILILVGLLIIIFSGVFVVQALNDLDNLKFSQVKNFLNKEEEKQILEDTDIDTTNWKTYRNEEFGFEFKYPEEWYIENYGKDGMIFIDKHPFEKNIRLEPIYPIILFFSSNEKFQDNSYSIFSDPATKHEGSVLLNNQYKADRYSYYSELANGKIIVFLINTPKLRLIINITPLIGNQLDKGLKILDSIFISTF